MKALSELRGRRTDLAKEARQLLDDAGDNWEDGHQDRFNEIETEISSLDEQIGRQEKVLEMEVRNNARIERRVIQDGISDDLAENNIEMEKSIFAAYLRGGRENLNEDQRGYINERAKRAQNALSTGTDSEGGVLAPTDFAAVLLEEMKAFGGMREVANVVSTADGNEIQWPITDATSEEGEILGENSAAGEQDTSFGTVGINAYKFSSKYIAVPFELLQDSKIDIEGYIRRLLSERIARITNRLFTAGTGTNQPKGVVEAAGAGTVGATGQTASITFEDLIDLEHSIDPAYRASGNARWMFHDQTLKILKKLKDADGRPLWMPGLTGSEPDTILGYGYTINQHMPEMAADAKSVLFGNFKKYLIRDVMQIMLFRMTDSAFTIKGQVGFLAFSRHDGDLIDSSSSGIKYYQNSST